MNKLPMGWVEVELGEIFEIVSGGTPKSSNDDFFTNPPNGIAWLTPADLSGYQEKYISHGKRNITESGYKSCSARLMPRGSVVFSSRTPIGYVAIAKNELCTNQGFKSFVANKFVSSDYLYYYLKSIKDLADSLGTGTTFKEISATTCKKIPFILPPKAEQDHIATLLDNHLSQVATISQKLNDILLIIKQFRQSVLAQAVSGKLLADLDFENWQKVTLGQIADWSSGGTPSRKNPEYYNGDIAWIKTGDLGEKYINQTSEHITQEAIKNSSAKLFPKGSVALAMYGATIGKTSILGIDATTNQACAVALPKKEILDTEFLYYLLLSEKKNFIAKSKGGAQPNISQTIIKNHEVMLPPFPEQQQIVTEVERLFAVTDSIETQVKEALERVGHLTQSILHQAFTGNLSADWRACNADLITGEHSATALLAQIQAKPTKRTTKKADA